MNKKISEIIIFLLIILTSCSRLNDPQDRHGEFLVYLLKDENLTTEDAESINMENLELAGEPWLETEEIKYYDFSSHTIYLKKEKEDFITSFDVSVFGRPFVVIAGNERIYLGSFHTPISSWMPKGPRIEHLDTDPKDIIQIKKAANIYNDPDFIDMRNDIRIKQALMRFKIYREN